MKFYNQSLSDVYSHLNSSENGLTSAQAQAVLDKNGPNKLDEAEKITLLQRFTAQLKDPMIIILLVAAAVSAVTAFYSGESLADVFIILAVVLLNAVMGVYQESKAEKAIEALSKMTAATSKVIRDGKQIVVESTQLVTGDVIVLEAGDAVPADARIIECASIKAEEAALTGESVPVSKTDEVLNTEDGRDIPLGDRKNMVYMGSTIAYGRGKAVITGTGMNTEMGKIASLMSGAKDRKTPLQKSLDSFSKKLAIVIMVISVIVFALRMWQKEPVLDSLMFAVALAVAAIPEALSSIVTIVQAIGTKRMATENAIVKELKAVESLGCVSVICSDKTGTLTQNKMTATGVYIDGRAIEPQDLDINKSIHRYFLYTAILNNDSSIGEDKEIGDPTETCLLTMARNAGLNAKGISEEDIRSMMPRLEEIPFDSDRKLMSTKYMVHGVPTIFTKGAVDVLGSRFTHILTSDGVREITGEDLDNILEQNKIYSENGLRVLAFAYKECEVDTHLSLEYENDYTFIGLVAMIDPPRPESIQAVADAISAGIKPIMITGDHKVTATAIAKQIGIFTDGDMAVTGQEIDKMTDEELNEVLERISVYARVSPENKIRIVNLWQERGKIVAMTGDGVNDAPALKKADIGVAMGITGTEVSKDASAMILADDNFATIIKAVLNGRNVYRNILNAIQFLLSGNLAAILAVVYCSVMALGTPFEPVHLLFINLLTDSLPALAIGMEPIDKNLLKNKPRSPKEGILTKKFSLSLLAYGLLIGVVTMAAYYIGYEVSPKLATTMAFATLTLARLFHGFNCRSDRSIFKVGLFSNKWSVGAFFVGVVLLAAVLFVPFMKKLFVVETLSITNLLWIAGLAIVPTVIIQIARGIKAMVYCLKNKN